MLRKRKESGLVNTENIVKVSKRSIHHFIIVIVYGLVVILTCIKSVREGRHDKDCKNDCPQLHHSWYWFTNLVIENQCTSSDLYISYAYVSCIRLRARTPEEHEDTAVLLFKPTCVTSGWRCINDARPAK